MRILHWVVLFCFLFCLLMAPSGRVGAQQPAQTYAEPDAPKPTAIVQTLLDEAAKKRAARRFEEGLQATDRALAAAKQAKDTVGEAGARRERALSLGALNRVEGVEGAISAWRETVSAWERVDDGPGRVEALAQWAALLVDTKPEEATRLLALAQSLATAETKRPLAAARATASGAGLFYNRPLAKVLYADSCTTQTSRVVAPLASSGSPACAKKPSTKCSPPSTRT